MPTQVEHEVRVPTRHKALAEIERLLPALVGGEPVDVDHNSLRVLAGVGGEEGVVEMVSR
jgi:hypothetical protein